MIAFSTTHHERQRQRNPLCPIRRGYATGVQYSSDMIPLQD